VFPEAQRHLRCGIESQSSQNNFQRNNSSLRRSIYLMSLISSYDIFRIISPSSYKATHNLLRDTDLIDTSREVTYHILMMPTEMFAPCLLHFVSKRLTRCYCSHIHKVSKSFTDYRCSLSFHNFKTTTLKFQPAIYKNYKITNGCLNSGVYYVVMCLLNL
jgi:hypothetical protein